MAVATAISAGMSGANILARTGDLAAGGTQSLTQMGAGLTHTVKSFGQGFSQASSGFSAFYKGTGAAANAIVGATANTVKDMAMRQNQDKTIGQKFNMHMANKIYGMKNIDNRGNNEG